ncbi:MAG TPA: glycosyltransferase family 4 protein [Acidimicrobiales bacterium]|nr:glycosyltransferase family 4 protein [Acidimicrobiales bacterium]
MRIAHVSDCYLPRLGGIERQVHDLAVRQRRAGHDVVVVTSAAGGAHAEDDVQVVAPRRVRGVNPSRVRYDKTLHGRKAVMNGGFDVVHVHASSFSPLSFLTAAAASTSGIPTALTVHSLMANYAPLFRWADYVTRWSRWPLAWSAVSTVAASPVQRIVGSSVPVTVLPNGVDPAAWRIPRRPVDAKRVVVATVGRLAVRKRPLALLRMLREVRFRLPKDIELEAVLVGDGPLRSKLEGYIRRNRMQGWVSLTGTASRREIRTLYADTDIYVAPATLESFGIAALEARCAGLPVVAHSGSGVADFITHGSDGFLTDDDEDMVDSITNLCLSPALRDTIGSCLQAEAAPAEWGIVLDATMELYERARQLALPPGRVPAPIQLV